MEDFVTYEQARILKDLGFDWECTHYYDDGDAEIKEQSIYVGPTAGESVSISDVIDGGFNKCNGNAMDAPTLSQAAKWLREVKEICVTSSINIHKGKYKFNWSITLFKEGRGIWDESVIYDTYEDALSAGIDRALELKMD